MGGVILMAEEVKNNVETNEDVTAETKPEETTAEKQEVEKKYNDDDVDKIVKQKFAKWQKEQEAAAEKARKEAEMTAEEKIEAQRKELEDNNSKLQSDLMSKDVRIAALLKGVDATKLDKFAKLASLSDKETAEERADEVLVEFPEFAEVAKNNNEKPPFFVPEGNNNNGGGIQLTKENFDNMSYGERKELKDKQPEVYKQLTK